MLEFSTEWFTLASNNIPSGRLLPDYSSGVHDDDSKILDLEKKVAILKEANKRARLG
jgi:hypothetical protein